MAEALLQVVFENLNALILNEYGLLRGFEEEIEKLSSTLTTIRAVIKDAEEREVREEAVRNWLKKLKNAAYDVDDLLDECATKALQAQVDSGIGCSNIQVRSFYLSLSCFEQVLFRRDMGHRVKKIAERIDAVAAEKEKFGLTEVDSRVAERKQTDSFLAEPQVYGREEDLERIVKFLVTETSDQEGVPIYAVIGLGGLGKTTLAKLAYNDERVKRANFDLRVWVCVSEDFDEPRLLKEIIEDIEKKVCDLIGLNPMKHRLQEKLSGKRFLLVLDDVWNQDQGKWDSLKHLLTFGADGSKLIVTTRIENVALVMGALYPHRLTGLSEDDCWTLFQQRAFGVEPGVEDQNLVAIGKEIVKKCAGVPLAAKALGGLMRSRREESYWLFVKDSEIWVLKDENQILPALRLSYNYLPSNLKQCFAFCSIFPKDYEIYKERLILLWMANGFLSSEGRSDLEDIGQEIFNELLGRSFFQDVEKDDDGNIIKCKMHDLVHDLAQFVMRDECYSLGASRAANDPRMIRYSPLICEGSSLSSITTKTLRTFILEFPYYQVNVDIKKLPNDIFTHCRCLRVLDLSTSRITKLPYSLGSLIHLRFLNLSNTQIKTLPESTSSLQNLQTLILEHCYVLLELPNDIQKLSSLRYLDITWCRSLTHIPESTTSLKNLQTLILGHCSDLLELPKDINKMSSLRYLDIGGCDSLTHMPAMIGQLSCLKTLTVFIVGKESGWRIGELQGLDLKGELKIEILNNVRNKEDALEANLLRKENLRLLEILNNVRNKEDALEANLLRKENLRLLELSWKHDGDSNSGKNVEEVLEGLQPHHKLKCLLIRDYAGIQFPSWMMELLLPNLVEISLYGCRRCERLPPLGQLPCLKRLTIHGMDEVSCIGNEIYGGDSAVKSFPSLKKVKFEDMPNLEKWSIMDRRIDLLLPCLNKLTVRGCPKLAMLPRISSLQNLKLEDCNPMILGSVANLSSLSFLKIDGFDEVVSFPQGMLSNLIFLKYLHIEDCLKLTTLSRELDNLVALNELQIWDCKELVSLPNGLGNLSSLQYLSIGGCTSLMSLPDEGIRGLCSLQGLRISNCDNLRSLSEGLQYLTALRYMTIQDCPEMDPSLLVGMENLNALRDLEIRSWPRLAHLPQGLQHLTTTLELLLIEGCSGLIDLPEWLGNLASLRSLIIMDCCNITCLPEGLQRLTALQTLEITNCPNLERRCAKNKGEDWHKIQHLPEVIMAKKKKQRRIGTLLRSSCIR